MYVDVDLIQTGNFNSTNNYSVLCYDRLSNCDIIVEYNYNKTRQNATGMRSTTQAVYNYSTTML